MVVRGRGVVCCGVDGGWQGMVELGGDIDGDGPALDPHGRLGAVQWVFVQDVTLDPVLARFRVGTEVVALDALPVRLAGVHILERAHQRINLLLRQTAWLLFCLFQWLARWRCG